MFENFQSCYKANPAKRYFEKAKCFFDQMDYMTSAMYLVPLIEFRINELMDFPNGMSYKKKYSQKGFEKHLEIEYKKMILIFIKGFYLLKFIHLLLRF